MPSFQSYVTALENIGAEVNLEYEYRGTPPDRVRVDLDRISNVKLPLSAEEWTDLCSRDGTQYIGGCCGASSAVQDVLNGIFREGGWVNGTELSEIAEAMKNHDGDSSKFTDPAEPLNLEEVVRAEMGPWDKIALTWLLAKDHFSTKVPQAPAPHKSELDQAIRVLESGLRYFSFRHMFSPKEEREKIDNSSQERANVSRMLYRILPALKMLNEHIDELKVAPFEGFALIDKQAGPEEVASNGHGYCIYETQAEVDALLDAWRKDDEMYQDRKRQKSPIDESIVVRRVRVSWDKGFEFLS